MPKVKAVAECSLGDLKSELRALKKIYDSLYEEHQRSHGEFMEHGTGGQSERNRLFKEGRKLDEEAEEILQAAQEINREVDRRGEGLTNHVCDSCEI